MAKRFGLMVSAVFAALALCACGNTSSPSESASNSPSATESESESTETGRTIVTRADPRGDVMGIGPEAEDFDEATPAPPRKQYGDIVSTSVGYTATLVGVRANFADFPPDPRIPRYRVVASLTTNTTGVRQVTLYGGGGVGSNRPIEMSGDKNGGSAVFACDGLDGSIDEGHNAVTISIPRACLRDPQWLRVDAACLVFEKDSVFATIDGGVQMFARIPKPRPQT
jgi:hypothetical protein